MSYMHGSNVSEWSRDMNLKLIAELKKRKSLWNQNSYEYKNKTQRKIDFQELSAIFMLPCSEIEKRIHNLKRQFHRENRKSQAERIIPYKSHWYGYELMKFLIEKDTENVDQVAQRKIHLKSTGICNIDSAVSSSTNALTSNELYSEMHLDKKDEFLNSKEVFYTSKVKDNIHLKNRDEFTVFGEYVTYELRKITNPYMMAITKHKIQECLFDAQMSEFSSVCDLSDNGDQYAQCVSQNKIDCFPTTTPSSSTKPSNVTE